MYYEVNLIEAIMAHHNKKKGFVITQGEVGVPFESAFEELLKCRFIVDDPEIERTKAHPVEVPAVEIPEAKMEIVTPEKRKRGKPSEAEQHNIEQRILQAWNGDRSIMDVVKATGYDYRTVRKYLPETVNG